MIWTEWLTDTVAAYRVVDTTTDGLTTKQRQLAAENIPCRVHRSGMRAPRMREAAAEVTRELRLTTLPDADIQSGDELIITQGAQRIRAFAGQPVHYHVPAGVAAQGLAHLEVPLLQQELI